MRYAHIIFISKPQRKRTLGRPRPRWDVIRMDLKETGWTGVD
jgi:hypothetical protein